MASDIDQLMESGKQKFFRFDRKGALALFRKAFSKDPENSTISGWIAITLAFLGDYDEAASIVENIKDEECPEILLAKGEIAEKKEKNYEY